MATQQEEKENFNKIVLNEESAGRKLTPYTWIVRWQNSAEYTLNLNEKFVEPARDDINFKDNDLHKYIKQVVDSKAHIVIYHTASESKLKKNCSDIDHFHLITWYTNHPTSEHSFIILKKLMNERVNHPYNISCPKVYNPYGLCIYFEKEPEKRQIVAAGNLKTEGQLKIFNRLTTKELAKETTPSSDEDYDINNKNKTLRGKKYDFIKKVMKKCNSTDVGDLMVYCKNTKSTKTRKTWENIFRNTPNLNNIVSAAATDVNIETKVTPIWEQIRQKKKKSILRWKETDIGTCRLH